MTTALQSPVVDDPEVIRSILRDAVVLARPGVETDLPGTLIEDILSTDTLAIYQAQQAKQEVISSVSPATANLYVLNLLGKVYGIAQGLGSNTAVYVVFSGTPGYVVPKGTIVSDGTHNYITQSAVVIGSLGASSQVYSVATVSGSWAVPADTVTTIASSVPSGIILTVDNLSPGIPATSNQSPEAYRRQVMDAGLVACVGTVQAVKTALKNVQGVVDSLISIVQIPAQSNIPILLKVIVGGGDQFEVAFAIWQTIGNPGALTGSVLNVTNITNSTNGLVTTNNLHLYDDGDIVTIDGVIGMVDINGFPFTVTVNDPYSFFLNVDTTAFGTYDGGGVCTPNQRNVPVTIYDNPDSYAIVFVIPPQQPVTINIRWQTTLQTAISDASIYQYSAQPIIDYINSIPPGGYINYLEVQNIFQSSIAPIVPIETLIAVLITTTINGITVSPPLFENVIRSDSEGYYFMGLADISFHRG